MFANLNTHLNKEDDKYMYWGWRIRYPGINPYEQEARERHAYD
jgi:hypothetical protein